MRNLCQLGMRNAELPAPDRHHTSDGGVLERVAKGVSADHSCRANDHKALLARHRNVHVRLGEAAKALIEDVRLVGVITVRAPPSSRRTADARQIAKRRRSLRTGPSTGELQSSGVV